MQIEINIKNLDSDSLKSAIQDAVKKALDMEPTAVVEDDTQTLATLAAAITPVAPPQGTVETMGSEKTAEAKPAAEPASPVAQFPQLMKDSKSTPMKRAPKFIDEIKILLIPQAYLRIICHYLGGRDVADARNASVSQVAMIGLLMQESVPRFMQSMGYKFAGEFLLTQQGNIIPVTKHTWTINTKTHSFTSEGIMFFEHTSGRKEDNIVFSLVTDFAHGVAGISLYSTDEHKSKRMLDELNKFTKQDNCMRGGKLRDINCNNGTFQEVEVNPKYTWENYFYPKKIRDLMALEVFGFLDEVEKYNRYGIFKRGILLHGPPGTGKTTLGRIISQYAKNHTVMWITPDTIAENNNAKMSIKILYELADYIGPSAIILEDLDLFTEDRDNQQGNMTLGALMNILDGINSIKNIVTIGTTNRIELIEKALANRPGRIDSIAEIGVMEERQRRQFFSDRLKDCDIEDDAMKNLVEETEDWTPAECNGWVEALNLYFINHKQEDSRKVDLKVVNDVLTLRRNFSLEKDKDKRKRSGFSS